MNITGYGQYSKEVAGIKDPKKLMNQQLKLIFIYPILSADKIRVQSTPPFDQLIRDFISVTFLSDLFVQNLFNVIGSANQIRPLWDERNEQVDPMMGIIRATGAQQGVNPAGYGTAAPNYNVDASHAATFQSKIHQKTAIIQRLLKADPKFAKLRPYVETITLGNMIDVPVIVGTSYNPVDTLTLMWVLIAAIGLNRPLNSQANLDAIFHELENMNEKKYWTLLNNLIQSPTEKIYIGTYFQRSERAVLGATEWAANKFAATRGIGQMAHNRIKKIQDRIDSPPDFVSDQSFAPLYLKQKELDATKLYFKFVMDPKFARDRFGINTANEMDKTTELSAIKLQGQLNQIKTSTFGAYNELISTAGSVLAISVGNIISANPSNLNIVSLKDQYINQGIFGEKIDKSLSEILIAIDNSVKSSLVEESRSKIATLKKLCAIDTGETVNDIQMDIGNTSIATSSFTESEFRHFMAEFNKDVAMSDGMIQRLENQLDYVTTDKDSASLNAHLKIIRQEINQAILDFRQPFITELNNSNISNLGLATGATSNQQVTNALIPDLVRGMGSIFYFMFLSTLQMYLCKFIVSADVDLETASNEVTEWPNYTLVLPVEIILALHAAAMGRSWQHLLAGGRTGQSIDRSATALSREQVLSSSMPDVNENYIKGIVKFISARLQVPNLIVVDSRKGEIHYKLMNQTDVNKTKITTISTFIESHLNKQMTSQY